MSLKGKTSTETETKEAFRARILGLIQEADRVINEGSDYLIRQGKVLDLAEWVTIKEYCKRFDIKNTETVSNWIKRGIIPVEDTMVVEEFNNIRMLKAKPYLKSQSKKSIEAS